MKKTILTYLPTETMDVVTILTLIMVYTLVVIDDVTSSKIKASCNKGESLVQVSGYDQAYFNTTNVQLLKESLQGSPIFCMWKNGCKLKVAKGSNKQKKLWFKENMRCLKNETRMYDLITTNISQNSNIWTLNKTTVVRSHNKFPWNYALCDEETTYALIFSTRENLIGKFKVVLQIVFVDLDSKYDSLSLKNQDRSLDIKKGRIEMPITNLDYVRLEFTSFRPRNRMGCLTSAYKGFLLCMKLVENTQHNVGICDEVMNDVAVNTLKRKVKKQKRMKRTRGKKIRKRNLFRG